MSWNGKRYWMAFTPYPGGDSAYENPSIVCSDDGTTWAVPDGLTNPIDAAPGDPSFNADTEILIGQDDEMYCFYMDSNGSTQNRALVRSSADGVTWGDEAALFTTAWKGFASPAVIWDGSQYVMWYVDAAVSPYKLYRRTCATPDGTWSAATLCTAPVPPGYAKDLWHLDIVLDSGTYYCFMTLCTVATGGQGTILWLYRSSDGLSFLPDANFLLIPSTGAGWDNERIYRATAVKTAGGFDLWYSAAKSDGTWNTGKTTVTL